MNGIIIIDKEPDWTSNDVVCKLRGVLHERRTGHGGTLDPMATGVLPVFVGRATRAVQFCENADKEYEAVLRLGITTDTQDTTGSVISECSDIPDESALLAVLSEFTGKISQVPPMYSAVKVGGKKLYELARKGVEIERKSREIEIRSLTLKSFSGTDAVISVTCSKGTYIRTLCHDIGQRLGCGGAMAKLRRTRAGAFSLENAYTIGQVSDMMAQGDMSFLRSVDSLFASLPAVTINEVQEKKCRCGNEFKFDTPNGDKRVYSQSGEFLMVGHAENGIIKTVRSFFEV